MPSASLPDDPAQPEDGEVVEVFTGDTLEEAMAAAVEALGPDLAVRRARKVRAGVRGLLGRDRYEVLAVPPPGSAYPGTAPVPADPPADGDAVGNALEALLDAADEREASGPQARPVSRPRADRPLSARPAATPPPPPAGLPRGASAPAPLPPAPRSGGSPSRRAARPSPSSSRPPVEPAGEKSSGVPSRPAAALPSDLPDLLPDVLAAEQPRPAAEPPVRRRRALGLPLAGRTPHPDPGVGDHPEPPATARPRRRRSDAGEPDAAAAPPVVRAAPVVPPEAPPVLPLTATVPREPARPARAAKAPARRPRPATGWSRASLSALGVPEAVLDELPAQTPEDDLAWVVALTAAIEAVVPAPAEPDEAHPVVVSGHGLAGALAVLDAGSRGLSPGTLSHAGRTVPATATELALVLRHHLTGS